MDFALLKKKFTDATAPLIEKAAPIMEKAKDAGFKAIDFTQKQLQHTPLVLKTIDEYKDFLTKKRAIIIAYNETDPSNRDILMRIPLWSTRAWSDAAELRLIETSKESELSTHLSIQTPVDMRVSYIGEETFHGTDVASVIKWWETRCYDGKCEEDTADDTKNPQGTEGEGSAPPQESVPPENTIPQEPKIDDPLAGK